MECSSILRLPARSIILPRAVALRRLFSARRPCIASCSALHCARCAFLRRLRPLRRRCTSAIGARELPLHLLVEEIAHGGDSAHCGMMLLRRTFVSALRFRRVHGHRTARTSLRLLQTLHQFINAALLAQRHLFEKRHPLREFMNPCQFIRAHTPALCLRAESTARARVSHAPRGQCAR